VREHEGAMFDVQGRHVRVHDESIIGIRKGDSWGWWSWSRKNVKFHSSWWVHVH